MVANLAFNELRSRKLKICPRNPIIFCIDKMPIFQPDDDSSENFIWVRGYYYQKGDSKYGKFIKRRFQIWEIYKKEIPNMGNL